MKIVLRAIVVIALGLSGCASAKSANQGLLVEQPIPAWPASVTDTCPERKVSVECFRHEGFPWTAISEGMANINEQLRGCLREDSVPLKIKLTIETRGGLPSCVEPSVWVNELEKFQSIPWLTDDQLSDAETARCAAAVVARDLVLPDSPPEEHCRWNSRLIR